MTSSKDARGAGQELPQGVSRGCVGLVWREGSQCHVTTDPHSGASAPWGVLSVSGDTFVATRVGGH